MKLNLGAGTDIKEGFTNVDIVDLEGIDVVHNLNEFPWPFDDKSIEYIHAQDVLEHVDEPVAFITECYRILKPGATLWIQTPRYDADFLWIDPTHKRGFHEKSMDFFDRTTGYGQTTGFYTQVSFSVKCEILPNKNLQFTMKRSMV